MAGTTEGIHYLGVELGPFGQAGETLRRERLVQFYRAEVRPTDAEVLWRDGGDCPGHDAGERFAADARHAGLVSQPKTRGAVVEWRGVTRRHRAIVRPEDRTERGEPLERCGRANAFVMHQVDVGYRDDLVSEHAGVDDGGGPLVTPQCEGVLGFSGDRSPIRQQFRRLAQRDGPFSKHFRIYHPPTERGDESVALSRAKPDSGFTMTQGARNIDSTPPARQMKASPAAIIRAAWTAASMPEPHKRFTVAHGTETGRPARSTAIRAALRLSSPAPFASPK